MTRKDTNEYTHLIYRAYIRDGSGIHTGESVVLACMLRCKGKGRGGQDMTVVRRIMRDHNLDN